MAAVAMFSLEKFRCRVRLLVASYWWSRDVAVGDIIGRRIAPQTNLKRMVGACGGGLDAELSPGVVSDAAPFFPIKHPLIAD